jgi:hypothetical protein
MTSSSNPIQKKAIPSLRNLLLSTSSTQWSPPPPPCRAAAGRSPHPSKKWQRQDATGGSISSPRAPSAPTNSHGSQEGASPQCENVNRRRWTRTRFLPWRSLSSSRRRRISRFRSLACGGGMRKEGRVLAGRRCGQAVNCIPCASSGSEAARMRERRVCPGGGCSG